MTKPTILNLFTGLAHDSREEKILALLSAPNVRIDRIVSNGQGSPPGFWWDQEWAEWVVLLTGGAGILFEGETTAHELRPGDYLHIPAHVRHRIEWTHKEQPTIWLAVHFR
jgi:cupin 2 domain-containing protein